MQVFRAAGRDMRSFEETVRCAHLPAGFSVRPELWPVSCRYAATALSVSRSRSRSQRRHGGAAAAAALLSAQAPLDVDEAERLIQRVLSFPTRFAGSLQHEGGLVAVMAECDVNISVQPESDSLQNTAIHIAGTAHSVGRAVSQIELQFEAFAEAERKAKAEADSGHMEETQIPQNVLSAALGPNGADLPKVRQKFGGIMIALMPPKDGVFTAMIGPGTEEQVQQAKADLLQRVAVATSQDTPRDKARLKSVYSS
ncbi:unnamed protein product [Effrenium voratum]|nr:unnamed protein product [Effrenium voratum]